MLSANELRAMMLRDEADGAKSVTCERKVVCSHVLAHFPNEGLINIRYFNGAYGNCTNEVGNCGCRHSEVFAVCDVFKQGLANINLYIAVTWSPCTPCAHLIAESHLFTGCCFLEVTPHDPRGVDIMRDAGMVILRTGRE
jgi:hypothetical protein